jgi:hypothetical protein
MNQIPRRGRTLALKAKRAPSGNFNFKTAACPLRAGGKQVGGNIACFRRFT